jgi:hypothetical protein
MITVCTTQAQADAIAGPKSLWYDLGRIVVYTGSDMPPAPPTVAEIAAMASAEVAAMLTSDTADDKRAKAIILVIQDQLNATNSKINSILDAIDAATTLPNLKTAVAAIANMPITVPSQIKTAVMNKINSGDADG